MELEISSFPVNQRPNRPNVGITRTPIASHPLAATTVKAATDRGRLAINLGVGVRRDNTEVSNNVIRPANRKQAPTSGFQDVPAMCGGFARAALLST